LHSYHRRFPIGPILHEVEAPSATHRRSPSKLGNAIEEIGAFETAVVRDERRFTAPCS